MAIRPAEPVRSLASTRGYLPVDALLIKPIAAVSGDIVCRFGTFVAVKGRRVARAHMADLSARALPRWRGCRRLTASEVFVLSEAPDSFDSRYIGPVDRRSIVGVAHPLWVFPDGRREAKPP